MRQGLKLHPMKLLIGESMQGRLLAVSTKLFSFTQQSRFHSCRSISKNVLKTYEKNLVWYLTENTEIGNFLDAAFHNIPNTKLSHKISFFLNFLFVFSWPHRKYKLPWVSISHNHIHFDFLHWVKCLQRGKKKEAFPCMIIKLFGQTCPT